MEIKLSKRMQLVADMVKENTVVDIGCDHAFVSIYLAGKPNVKRVVAMDVKTGPVDIAKANVAAYGYKDKIEVRMSDGFDKLSVGEADVAVIAGMGGYLMIDILQAGIEHIKNGIGLVLQPQSDIRVVREYLDKVGYLIEDENMLIEDGKYYTIIRAVPRGDSAISYTEDDYSFGPVLLKGKHSVLKSYLEKMLAKDIELLDKLKTTGSDKSKDRINQLIEEMDYIRYIKQQYFGEDIGDNQ